LDPDDPAPHPNVVADISDPDDMEAPTPTQVKYCFLKLTTTLILSNAVELNVLIRIQLYCVFFQIIKNFSFLATISDYEGHPDKGTPKWLQKILAFGRRALNLPSPWGVQSR
jgi:hypothetical protein